MIKRTPFWSERDLFRNPGSERCVTLGEAVNLSGPPWPSCKLMTKKMKGGNYVKCLSLHLAHREHLTNDSCYYYSVVFKQYYSRKSSFLRGHSFI